MVTEKEINSVYNDILPLLATIYSKFMNGKRGPEHSRDPSGNPKGRTFTKIPLIFGSIMGGQPGIFLGDLPSEKHLWEKQYNTKQTAVIIDVKTTNEVHANLNNSGVAVLLAHELGHAYRWSIGHVGGSKGYTNEEWARHLELAYVEAVKLNVHSQRLEVNFKDTKAFIVDYRKRFYKENESEKKFYTKLTGDSLWPSIKDSSNIITCPKGDPNCHHPKKHLMFHKNCKKC